MGRGRISTAFFRKVGDPPTTAIVNTNLIFGKASCQEILLLVNIILVRGSRTLQLHFFVGWATRPYLAFQEGVQREYSFAMV